MGRGKRRRIEPTDDRERLLPLGGTRRLSGPLHLQEVLFPYLEAL